MGRARVVATLVVALTAAGDSAITPSAVLAGDDRDRPDIVVIVLDDVPLLDGRHLRVLPIIRRTFIDSGLRFTEMYVETPVCCPGRAGWLTGQHTHNHDVVRNDVTLFDPSMTLATQLDAIGYETIMAGKYMNRYVEIAPTVPPGWDHFHALGGGYFDYRMWNDGDPEPEVYGSDPADYSTDVIADKVVADIAATPRSRPLFAWIAPFASHHPTTPAPRHASDPDCGDVRPWRAANYNERDVSDKPAYIRDQPLLPAGGYDLVDECRTLLAVDDLLGAVRHQLERERRLDDTLLILASDNGMNAGAHRLVSKGTPYSTEVPFFMSWPARFEKGSRSIGERLSNIDLAPTVCQIAGCTLGPYPNGQTDPDGLSFASLLTGDRSSLERDALLESMPAGSGNAPPWFALATTADSPWSEGPCPSAAVDCLWHYVEYDTGERELYDVTNGPCWTWQRGEPGDPCELENVAGQPGYEGLEELFAGRLARLKQERGH